MIIMRSNNQLTMQSACSLSNGIVFLLNENQDAGIFSSVDDSGNISCQHVDSISAIIENRFEKSKLMKIKFTITCIILIVSLFLVVYFFSQSFFMTSLQFLLGGFSVVSSFILFTENIEKESARFHAAEHMAINAFNYLGRVPTLKEIRTFSRFHQNCGTNYITLFQLDSLILFIGSMFSTKTGIYIALFLVALSIILFKLKLLSWGQIFTTLPATDRELKVAIAGVQTWLHHYEEENTNDFEQMHH